MNSHIPCGLCGSTSENRLIGRTGCVCRSCLGEAAKQLVTLGQSPHEVTVTASDRCLLCGEGITTGHIAAVRGPYRICHACVVAAVEQAAPLGASAFVQVNF